MIKPKPICYFEIPAKMIEEAKKFYSSVFYWKIEESHLTDQKYSMFSTGDDSLIGGLDSTKEASDHGVLIYIKVEDIPLTLQMIENAGGKVIRTKF